MGVILLCKVATHNEYMLKLSCDNMLQIFSAVFKLNIVWISLQGKVITKIKRVICLLRHSVFLANELGPVAGPLLHFCIS